MEASTSKNVFPTVAGMILLVAIFLVDAFVELGVAGGVLYILPVLMAWYGRQSSHVVFAGLIGSLLTVFGYFLSPEGTGEEWKVLINRGLSLLAIWATVFPCYFSLSKKAGFIAPKTGIAFRIGILAFTLVLVTATVIGVVSFKTANEALIEKEVEILGNELEMDAHDVLARLKAVRHDVQFLTKTPPVQGIIRAQSANGVDPFDGSTEAIWKNRLVDTFKELIRGNPDYVQVRFIGLSDDGREIVRVEQRGETILSTGIPDLQKKGSTEYVQKTLLLQKGQLYLSEVTLNREFNKVVVPHKPVMRLAAPVFNDATGSVFGIVVINLDFGLILDRIARNGDNYFVTNSAGDFLSHPEKYKTFGFDLEKIYTIQREFPDLKAMYAPENIRKKIWLRNKSSTLQAPILYFQKVNFDPLDSRRFIGLVKVKPFSEVAISSRQVLENIIWLAVTLILIAALVAIYFSRVLTRPLTEIVAIADTLAEGNYEVRIKIKGSAEAELLGTTMDRLRSNLKKLTTGLKENEDRLKENALRLEEERNKLVEESWLKSNLNQIMMQIEGKENLQELGFRLLGQLVPMTSAYAGAFYVKIQDAEYPVLKLYSSYAYHDRKPSSGQYKMGEGLIGQCGVEERKLKLNMKGEDGIKVASGSLEVVLRCIIVVPVMFEGTLLGVIELATPGDFTVLHERLFSTVAERIGFVINNINNQNRTIELLEQSQSLSRAMRRKTEELQLANEQLEQRSIRLHEQKNEIEIKRQEIQKAKEEIEKKARDLELASQYKSEFLANMSHELRTPLNSMLLLSNNLVKNKDSNLTQEQVEAASYINKGGKNLLDLINEILDLSKIEAGMTTVELEEVSIRDIVDTLQHDFVHVAIEKGLKLNVALNKNLPSTLITDKSRLCQILGNLLSNAIKFTDVGSVRVDFSRTGDGVALSSEGLNRENTIAIAVTDTGIGIHPDKQELIFEAFRQGDEGVARKYGGTGLGLSISNELSHLLGGEIHIKSEVGKGSTFTLFLPVKTDSKSEGLEQPGIVVSEKPVILKHKEGGSQTPSDSQKKVIYNFDKSLIKNRKILVVDDDMRNVFALSQLLQELGALPIKADSGSRALRCLEEIPNMGLLKK
jgi:signal transduction histidine kinase/HAMP domain-containing protein